MAIVYIKILIYLKYKAENYSVLKSGLVNYHPSSSLVLFTLIDFLSDIIAKLGTNIKIRI